MPRGTFVAEPTIRIDGTVLQPTVMQELADLRVEQAIDLPGKAVVRFFDPSLALIDAGTLPVGAAIEVIVDDGLGADETIHSGEIVSVTVETGSGGVFEIVVTSYDKAHRLARSVKVRTFVDQTDSDIVAVIARDHGLSSDIDATTITHQYVMQAESDHAFLTRRALALGYRWWVAGSKLHFKKVAAPPDGIVIERDRIVSLRIRVAAVDGANKVEVRGWNPTTQRAVVASATPSTALSNGFGSNSAIGARLASNLTDLGSSERFISGALPDQASADLHAASVGMVSLSKMVSVRGAIDGRADLGPATLVELKGLGSNLSGKYAITAVEHIISADRGYVSRFRCQGIGSSELVDLLAPPKESGRLNGLMVGVVTNIEDPDALGRVKVKFPTLSDQEESTWARLASPGAGNGRGLQVTPEVNDEVIVGFEQGDPAQPVVIGGVWSDKNKPPLPNAEMVKSGAVIKRGIVTRKGHRIEILEDGSDQKILVALADDKGSITMTNEGIQITTPGDLTVKADGAIAMTATKDVTIEGQGITLKAKSKVGVEGVEVAVKGSASVGVQAPKTEIKADATLMMNGGAMAELKGGMVKLN